MNRITRCPACASVYRVSDQQLGAAGGWLRCGHCQHVFDSTGFVLHWDPAAAGGANSPAPAVSSQASEAAWPVDGDRMVIDDLLQHEDRSTLVKSSPASDDLNSFEQALSTFRPPSEPLTSTPTSAADSEPWARAEPSEMMADEPEPTSRKGWFVLLGLLLVLLTVQLLYAQRLAVAQHWPALEAQLQSLCSKMSCELAPLQHPEGVVIESSGLVRRPDDLVLSWAVRNTTRSTVGMTALELTLLEAPDKPVLRKVFLPSQVGAPALLTPGQVWRGELMLRPDAELTFSDYRILSFYP